MEGFLEPTKCQYLIDTYSAKCKRSTVVDALGNDVVDPARTSHTFYMPNDDAVIVELRRKAAHMAGVPESHVEGLQLVRYAKGEQYKFHYDYFDAIRHNQREHTFLVYLNDFDVEDGGSTIFKNYAIKVYPKTGRCVWFRNMIDGRVNEKSLHAGEEVQCDKLKYAVNIWIREKPVDDYSSITVTDKGAAPDVVAPELSITSSNATPFSFVLFAILTLLLLVVVGWMVYTGISNKSFTLPFRLPKWLAFMRR